MTIWDVVANTGHGGFSRHENWGNQDKMSGFVLWLLMCFRLQTGWPVIVHCGYDVKGHSENSRHYQGDAVDFHFDTDTPYIDQVNRVSGIMQRLQVADFCGLGIYPDWNNPGFHIDTRGERARWGMVDRNGKQVQVGFSEAYEKAGLM